MGCNFVAVKLSSAECSVAVCVGRQQNIVVTWVSVVYLMMGMCSRYIVLEESPCP